MARILLIDDDEDCLLALRLILESDCHEVFILQEGKRLVKVFNTVNPDLVITDILMPGITGSMIYEKIREEIDRTIPIIVCSGTSLQFPDVHDQFLRYVRKPCSREHMLKSVRSLLSIHDSLTGEAKSGPA